MLETCPRCGRYVSGKMRCGICFCVACGRETDRARYSLCATCDARELEIAAHGDVEEVDGALATLTFRLDGIARDCGRCNGLGSVEVKGGGEAQAVEVCLACDNGKVLSPLAKGPARQGATSDYIAAGTATNGLKMIEHDLKAYVGVKGLDRGLVLAWLIEQKARTVAQAENEIASALSRGALTRHPGPVAEIPFEG